MPRAPSKRAAIVGVGLMGASLGLALRRRGWSVGGVGRSAAKLKAAKARGALTDFSTDLAEGVRDADVVVLAVPVESIVPLARRAAPHVKPGALVTDVGSVKGPIARGLGFMDGFVGAHPMCGSEKAGAAHGRADLYEGAVCVLTPLKGTPRAALAAAKSFWASVGARPRVMDAAAHDRAVAVVSHLPHLIAEALVLTAGREGPPAGDLAAGSFRDAARVAAADPDAWSQIFKMNRPALRRAASGFRRSLGLLLRGGPGAGMLRKVRKIHGGLLR